MKWGNKRRFTAWVQAVQQIAAGERMSGDVLENRGEGRRGSAQIGANRLETSLGVAGGAWWLRCEGQPAQELQAARSPTSRLRGVPGCQLGPGRASLPGVQKILHIKRHQKAGGQAVQPAQPGVAAV